MDSEYAQNRALSTAAGRVQIKTWAAEIIEREEGRTGGKMLAYDNLGRRIGRSGSWVRRLLGGVDVGIAFETFERMRLAYLRHCALTQADGAAAASRAAQLRAQAEAMEAQFSAAAKAPR